MERISHIFHSSHTIPGGYREGVYQSPRTVNVYYDQCPDNPRDMCDPFGTMLCFHRSYALGERHDGMTHDQFESWGEVEEHLRAHCDAVCVLPLYLYDHSGLSMNTTGFNCSWDSGQVGFIYATKGAIADNYGADASIEVIMESVRALLRCEVEEYDSYLRGEVYWYEVIENGVEIESCTGFYGKAGLESLLVDTGVKESKRHDG